MSTTLIRRVRINSHFELIDRTCAEQVQPVGINRGARIIAEQSVEAGLAAQERRRHAVHVGGDRRLGRVVIGMGVEPEHEQLASALVPVARHGIHRAHRQCVIAAEEDRQRPGLRDLMASAAQQTRPALDFAIVIGFFGRPVSEVPDLRHREIAVIDDFEIKAFEQWRKAGGAQRCGAHQCAALRSSHVDGRAEQGDAPALIRHDPIGHGNLLRSASLRQPNRDSHPSFPGITGRKGSRARNKFPDAAFCLQGRHPPFKTAPVADSQRSLDPLFKTSARADSQRCRPPSLRQFRRSRS
ncbi:hypothetical protein ACVW0J_004176 [Bradyrhizobium sp. i1.7.7]